MRASHQTRHQGPRPTRQTSNPGVTSAFPESTFVVRPTAHGFTALVRSIGMDKIMNITSRCLLLAATLLVPTLALGMTEPQLRRSGFVGVQVGPVTSESRSSNDVAANRGVVVL